MIHLEWYTVTSFGCIPILPVRLVNIVFEIMFMPTFGVFSCAFSLTVYKGIPVAQQHLIWNNLELDDEHCLHDYG